MDSLASGVGVLDKSVAVLAALAERGPLSLAGLVEATGLSRATAHRLAAALEVHRLVGRDGAGRYRLGLRLLGWAGAVSAEIGLVEAARPVLEGLRDETGESAQLFVRDGDSRLCVAASERPSGLRDTVPVGAVLPIDRGSGGKVLLAFGDGGGGPGIDPSELETIRRRGFAVSVAEREEGVCSVSAPVLDAGGRIHAALGVSGPINRLGRQPGRRLAGPVVAAARELERRAGLAGPAAGG
ncbi:MAG TPA: IclR family transcriptional regulator [Acidimicrobiia bacterium]|nr:IclR family transcriptional regulator [Acidimicrobiia bacterium]HZQ79699.1 IclR family transcriptional regulator [Acidimicrobiia bacterium]